MGTPIIDEVIKELIWKKKIRREGRDNVTKLLNAPINLGKKTRRRYKRND